MEEPKKTTVTMIGTVACAVAAWIPIFGLFGDVAMEVSKYAAPVVTFALGMLFGWAFRGSIIVPERETPHNKKCREVLKALEEEPYGRRFALMQKELEHDDIDGSWATLNALRSLDEQGCIGNVEFRQHLDGKRPQMYALGDISVTGKRYKND